VSLPRCECRRPRLQQQALVRDLTHMFLPDGGRSALKSTRSRSVCCLTHELSQLGPAFRGRFVSQRGKSRLFSASSRNICPVPDLSLLEHVPWGRAPCIKHILERTLLRPRTTGIGLLWLSVAFGL
jgi:hypothetical protein